MTYKQIIVIRKDLNMRKGKMVSQGAHASMKAILGKYNQVLDDDRVLEWLSGSFTKVCVSCNSEEELLELYNLASTEQLITGLIKDNGTTEFGGVKTYTALAIGPDLPENLNHITGHLKLL